MTPEDVVAWRKAYVLSRQQLADLLGIHPTTVSRWERGTTPPPRWLPLALETLAGQREKLVRRMHERRLTIRAANRAGAVNLVQNRARP